jgi:hypothetical protein
MSHEFSGVVEVRPVFWNRVAVPARQATQPGVIGSLESILGLHKSLLIRARLQCEGRGAL